MVLNSKILKPHITFYFSVFLQIVFWLKISLRILSSNNVCFKNMLDLKCYYKKTPCFDGFWFNSAYKFILELVHRVKRRADPNPMKNTCKLLVVADHRFYRYMGRGEESTTTNYLVSIWNWIRSLDTKIKVGRQIPFKRRLLWCEM